MKQKEREKIASEMKVLIGKRITTIGRLAATGNFGFSSSDQKEYVLRVETAFRFIKGDELLIANLDMFQPTKKMLEKDAFDWNTYNWDVQGLNAYDRWAVDFQKYYRDKLQVLQVIINPYGDLKILFSEDIILELLMNAASEECFRFFERTAEHHLVVDASGVENEP